MGNYFLIVNGNRIHYDTLHSKIRRKYGNAKMCSLCLSNDKKRYEWALIKGHLYSDNIVDYIPLCPSCHRKYDITNGTRLKMSKSKLGKGIGADNNYSRSVINTETGKLYHSLKSAAISVGLKRSTLTMMLNGSNPNKTKLKYNDSTRKSKGFD